MEQEVRRLKRLFKNPNPLFTEWLTEWREEADRKDSKMKYVYGVVCMKYVVTCCGSLSFGKEQAKRSVVLRETSKGDRLTADCTRTAAVRVTVRTLFCWGGGGCLCRRPLKHWSGKEFGFMPCPVVVKFHYNYSKTWSNLSVRKIFWFGWVNQSPEGVIRSQLAD